MFRILPGPIPWLALRLDAFVMSERSATADAVTVWFVLKDEQAAEFEALIDDLIKHQTPPPPADPAEGNGHHDADGTNGHANGGRP